MSYPPQSQVNFPPESLRLPLTTHHPVFKTLYIIARLSHLLILIPLWTAWYAFPANRNPHRSLFRSRNARGYGQVDGNEDNGPWTLRECVSIRLIKWMMPLNSKCALAPLSLDKSRLEERPEREREIEKEGKEKMKETGFVWVPPVPREYIKGVANDSQVKAVKLPAYVWPKDSDLNGGNAEDLVGLWIHGGGYMMGNATEKYGESEIPRQLSKSSKIKNILSIDYRLIHDSPHPGQLLDALSGYHYLVRTLGIAPKRVVLIGACAGGNLAMLLTRYLYEEMASGDVTLGMPGAIMLFSPVLDMAIDLEIHLGLASKRPNTSTDMLATSYIPNVRLMGGKNLDFLGSPWLSSNRASPNSQIYSGYPPTFLSIGSAECLCREVYQLYELLKGDGVDVEIDVREDAVHDFMAFPSTGPSRGGLITIPNERARVGVMERAAEWVGGLGSRV
ncbi:hypothetical protein VKT23_016771 [Stygiomarasmius scandens]|uniref:Alpha/beta hydrolase fold-3 domain-containing protein n=1 Tax=Marasmiellus scandens TaxID=2682957 RepID=A0ABR1IU10_9AGAR